MIEKLLSNTEKQKDIKTLLEITKRRVDWQKNHTPWNIIEPMTDRNWYKEDFCYLVLFAPEFVTKLIEYGVDAKKITLISDSEFESRVTKKLYDINAIVFKQESLDDNIVPLYRPLGRGKRHKADDATKSDGFQFSPEFKNKIGAAMPKSKKLIILGNPPYQKMTTNGTREGDVQSVPIYNKFIDSSIRLNPRYLSMIIPSRWMQGGRGLSDFRKRMMADKRIRSIRHFPGQSEVFKNVSIKGGVNYFLWDREHNGLCNFNGFHQDLNKYDIIVTDTKAFSILDKLDLTHNMSSIVLSSRPFGTRANFSKWTEGGIKCYSKLRKVNPIGPEDFTDKFSILNKWKVCIAEAGDPNSDKMGKYSPYRYVFIVEPNEICTETYIVVNSFDTKEEADNFINYMETKTFRYLVHLRAITQHKTREVFAFVPDLGDYSHPWNEKMVCEKMKLSDEEFAHIDSKIRDWK